MSSNNQDDSKALKSLDYKTDNIHVLIGKNAGDMLDNDIKNAQQSILVVSPYIASSKVDQLVDLSNNGVKVRLVFSEDDKIYYDEETKCNLRKIIKKESFLDEEEEKYIKEKNQRIIEENSKESRNINLNNLKKRKQQNKAYTISTILFLLFFALCGFYIFLTYKYSNLIKEYLPSIYKYFGVEGYYRWLDIVVAVLLIGISYKIYKAYVISIKNNPKFSPDSFKGRSTIPYIPKYINKYSYINDNISVTYSLKNKNNNSLIHSKYYVIDGSIVYMGSLNFTNNGMNNNIETTIKIHDASLAKEIKNFTENIFKSGTGIKYHNNFKNIEWNKDGEKRVQKSLAEIIYYKQTNR